MLVVAACGGGQHVAAPPCPAAITLRSADEVKAVQRCERAASLVVKTGAELAIAELALVEVTGDITIGPTLGLTDITLPTLRSVGGAVRIVSNTTATGVYLKALERAGSIAIENNGAVKTIALPALTEVGDLTITDNAELEIVGIDRLATVRGELALVALPVLSLLEAGSLARVARVRLDGLAQLPAEQASAVSAHAAAAP